MKRLWLTAILVIVAAVMLLGIGAVMYGIPAGSEITETLALGSRADGDQIIRETRSVHRIWPLSPEGVFYRGTLRYIDYYAHSPARTSKLSFFSDINLTRPLLEPVIPISGTKQWAAFRLSRVAREDVDLTMYVFDETALLHTLEIRNAVRSSRTAETFDLVRSYSVSGPGSDPLTVQTRHGLLAYDPRTGSLIQAGD